MSAPSEPNGIAVDVQPLVVRTFPLHGSRLIEASAGTGKTYTIAMLYLRLVLGHGDDDTRFDRPLAPPDILVVTFTDAAAKELRDRIRRRLVEAVAAFAGLDAPVDTELAALRDDLAPATWAACASRLQQAVQWMDEAAVQTIHSWCHRMLHTHVLDGAAGFDRELVGDDADLVLELARDYWRCHGYGLSEQDAALMQRALDGPDELAARLRPLLAMGPDCVRVEGEPLDVPDSVAQALAACRQASEQADRAMRRARDAWRLDRATIEQWLHNHRGKLHGNRHRWRAADDTFNSVLSDMAAWSAGGPAPDTWVHFAAGRLTLTGGMTLPEWPVWTAIAEAVAACDAVPDPAPALLLHAARDLRARIGHEKQRRARWGYDDLLTGLDQALHAEVGDALARRIRRQFPVAMIDEFQDTDPLQYRLFDRIYAEAAPAPEQDGSDTRCGLFLIGDPKQAIYGFRGADIYTYLKARRATQGRHYTLMRNYRATQALVDATNRCFQHAEHHAAGAFRFRVDDDNPVPFVPVAAQGRSQQLWLGGAPAAAMTFWHQESGEQGTVRVTAYRQRMSESAASAIRRWLDDTGPNRCGLLGDEGDWTPLRPADIAILVRNRQEAALMRSALSARGLASVYLSDQESVFQTPEADDLDRWLQACAAPGDDARVRAALGTGTLALDWQRLEAWWRDDVQWEAMAAQFREYQSTWRRQGVLPMVHRLMADFDLSARLLATPGGERSLTNLLQLVEWLQREAAGLEGEAALLRRFAARRDLAGGEDVLRLESDADRIRVVTIHKSKGLEYPLVLLPFIADWRSVRGGATTYYDPAVGGTLIELVGSAEAAGWADRQRLDEDMRLLYVAMTRARHAVWLGVAPLVSGQARACQLHQGAIGYLLAGGAPIAPADLPGLLQQMTGGQPHLAIEPVPAPDDGVYQPPPLPPPGPARSLRWPGAQPWWVASYSALASGTRGEAPAPSSADEDRLQEDLLAPPSVGRVAHAAQSDGLLAFPRGPEAGNFLHGLLEWVARQGFAAVARAPETLRDQVARRCQLRGWAAWIDPLTDWLQGWLAQAWPLPDGRDWVAGKLEAYQVEMEFWFPIETVALRELDAAIRRHVLPGAPRPLLSDIQVTGMLKGYIDLVFERSGRYYVADYKSNWLGPAPGDYGPDALRAAMLAHRYDLQYVLYLFALHRLLRTRIPHYRYQQHIGGVSYHFLRGEHSPGQGVYLDVPPVALMDELDSLVGLETGEAAP